MPLKLPLCFTLLLKKAFKMRTTDKGIICDNISKGLFERKARKLQVKKKAKKYSSVSDRIVNTAFLNVLSISLLDVINLWC